MMLTPLKINALEAAALAAPSADNRHVFRLDFDTDRIRLFAVDGLASAIQNRRVLGLLSIGAVCENLLLRGRQLGLDLRMNLQGPGQPDEPLVEFHAAERAASTDPLEQAIGRRHTNRRLFYGRTGLTEAHQRELAAEADGVAGTSLVWLDGPDRRTRALRLIRWAETERFRQPDLHAEMFESIRFDVGWNAASAEGIPPGALSLPGFERLAFSSMRHWKVQRVANWLGTHRFIGFRGGDLPCRLAPNLGAIAARGDTDQAAVQAGRLLQRVWLRATVLGRAMQVFAASPLYALEGSNFVAPELQQRLTSGWWSLSPDATPYLVFRIGQAEDADIRAGRPPQTARP